MRAGVERKIVGAAAVVLTLSALVIATLFISRLILIDNRPETPPRPTMTRSQIERVLKEAEDAASWHNKDYARAVQLLTSLAEQGEPRAQLRLGHMYADGKGVARDYETAADLYRRAADQGNAQAMDALAGAHFSGEGVERDYDAMARLYRQAANKGLTMAKLHLAVCYNQGWGVNKDLPLAYAWYTAAAQDAVRDPTGADLAEGNLRDLWKKMSPEERIEAKQRVATGHLD